MRTDYNYFRDSILVAVADAQTGSDSQLVHLNSLQVSGIDDKPTWLEMVGPDLKRLGYGSFFADGNDAHFHINGAGLSRAAEIRAERRPRTLIEHFKSINRSDWIAFGAFAVSLIALFK